MGVRGKTIVYITGCYGRASDTFIRDEVNRLRGIGYDVRTFSVRVPAGAPSSEDEAQARRDTFYVLAGGPAAWLRSVLSALPKLPPRRLASALRLSLRLAPPGPSGLALSAAYYVEGCIVAARLLALQAGHIHNHIAEGSATVAAVAAHLAGIPFSLTVHGPGEFDHPRTIRLGEKAARAAFTCAISSFCRSQIYRWVDRRHWPRVRVVRCAAHEDFLAAPLRAPGGSTMIVVGRLAPEKGHLILLDALAEVAARRRDFAVEIVGDGPLFGEIDRRVEALGLRPHVTLAGTASRSEVLARMADARCIVSPSFAEGLPVVLIEALALGRPVISTAIAGVPELVVPGETGWLVPAGSVSALAQAIDAMLDASPEALAAMGRAGREAVRRHHSPQRQAELLAALIEGAPAAAS